MLTGLVVAFVSAALAVGGGFLLVPYLASWLALPMFVVAGTSALAAVLAYIGVAYTLPGRLARWLGV